MVDSNIYGSDSTDFAEGIASDALNPAHQTPQAAAWRSKPADSEGAVEGEKSFQTGDIVMTERGIGGDGRARSKGNS